jgi:hypothetical protein
MIMTDAGPYKFIYNDNESYDSNFSVWSQLNTEERIAFNEEPYSREEQEKVFSKLFSNKA